MPLDEERLYKMVGERIRLARNSKKLSQARLAEHVNVTRASIVNIEAGRQRPPLHVLWRIAEELATELSLLIPSQADYRVSNTPMKLDDKTLADIERAANGDPVAWRGITEFIEKAKAQGGSGK